MSGSFTTNICTYVLISECVYSGLNAKKVRCEKEENKNVFPG